MRSCKSTCQTTFNSAKELCGVPADCRHACEADLSTCLAPFLQSLKACQDTCDAPLEAGRDSCKASVGCDKDCWKNEAFLKCRLPFAVTAFTCRKTCLDTQRLDPTVQAGITACKASMKACKSACKAPAATPTPAPAN